MVSSMILKDTQVRVVSFVNNSCRHTVIATLEVNRMNFKDFYTINHEQTNCDSPVIWLVLINHIDDISSLDIRQYHANHEQFVYLVANPPEPSLKALPLSLNIVFNSPNQTNLIKAISYAEQRILQRQHFLPSDIDDTFLKLKFYGRSNRFVKVVNLIKKVANTDTNVFIKGETGTGKELTARAIHYLSSRREESFIPINCGAFSDDLLLSELFGHEKGAFTGAEREKVGLLEMANNGTVFLDEVDSLSPKAQVALLRYLQDSEIRRVGSHHTKKLNVRIIAASNAKMKALIQSGDFREDLMYRLDVLQIGLPALRHRAEDIQLLAQRFLAAMALKNGNKTKVFHPSLLSAMQAYDWEGNVRELDNFVKRAYVLSEDYVIHDEELLTPEDDNPDAHKTKSISFHLPTIEQSFQAAKEKLVYQFEHDYLAKLLTFTQGNVSKAAKIAQKERRSFCRLMEKHGLDRGQFTL